MIENNNIQKVYQYLYFIDSESQNSQEPAFENYLFSKKSLPELWETIEFDIDMKNIILEGCKKNTIRNAILKGNIEKANEYLNGAYIREYIVR